MAPKPKQKERKKERKKENIGKEKEKILGSNDKKEVLGNEVNMQKSRKKERKKENIVKQWKKGTTLKEKSNKRREKKEEK